MCRSNDKTSFTASANYFLDNGMYIKDNYDKFGGRFGVEHKVYDNFIVKANANISHSRRHNNGYLSYNRNPIFPVYNDDGSYWTYSTTDYYHPLAITDLQKNTSEGTDIGKMKLPSHLLDALRSSLKMHLELQNHVLVDDGLGGMPRYLVHYVGEIFRGDIHLFGIIVHIP